MSDPRTMYLITFGNVQVILRLANIHNAAEVYGASLEKTMSPRDALLILNAVDAGRYQVELPIEKQDFSAILIS